MSVDYSLISRRRLAPAFGKTLTEYEQALATLVLMQSTYIEKLEIRAKELAERLGSPDPLLSDEFAERIPSMFPEGAVISA